MRVGVRPPLIVLTVALLALIVLLATLQYVWLGRISEAERERLSATLNTRTTEFALDFDRELTRAYLLFQADLPGPDQDVSDRFSQRYDRWNATSSYPRLIRECYLATRIKPNVFTLQRFDARTRRLHAVDWPASMADWPTRLVAQTERPDGSTVVIRRLAPPIWETVPALVIPAPMFVMNEHTRPTASSIPDFSYTLLTIDLDYVKTELLPALAERHFRKAGDPNEYQVAVLDRTGAGDVIYRSTPAFQPRGDQQGDASAVLFQVRTQDFSAMVAEVRRFATFNLKTTGVGPFAEGRQGHPQGTRPKQYSIVVQQGAAASDGSGGGAPAGIAGPQLPAPRWQVVVKHPAGSLEVFVGSTRRRNLIVSTSILAVLAASMVLLIVSTRRSQELARQQLEFVAAVSHELRTPLAVIRSAGENLADGVIHDEAGVRKYGSLIRAEGRRLSAMVEQILEFAGIQSGQRGFARHPVAVAPLIADVLATSQALIDAAHISVEVDVPPDLPPVSGDESALRRVIENLIGNAIKYGASGGWIGVRARQSGSEVAVTVSDRGIGIEPADQSKIFEPFYRAPGVVAARIQGAGVGLSLVRRIVHGHGGRVTLKSVPGQGSEFVVFLPIAGTETGETVRTTRPSAEPAQSS
jgi:signal transduction histidine kinase